MSLPVYTRRPTNVQARQRCGREPAVPDLVPGARGARLPRANLVDFWFGDGAERREEIEIAAFVGLPDMLGVQRPVTAWVMGCGLSPGGTTPGEIFIRDVEVNAALADIHFDLVAGPHKGEWPADKALRRHVKDAGTVAGTAHARIGDTQHVAYALLHQLLR